MKTLTKTVLLTTVALLIALPMAAADVPADTVTVDPATVDAPEVESPEAEATPEALLRDLLKPEATPQMGGCCQGALNACEGNCRATGIFEFNCDPDTCNSSCICNLG